MKIFHLIICLLPLVSGATHRIIPDSELSAKMVLYQKIKTLKTTFHQVKNIKSIQMELKSEGEMELKRPDEVIWTIKKPGFSKVELHGNKITLISGQGSDEKKQSMLLGKETDPNVSKAILSMMAWMRMDIPEIQKSYVIVETGNNEFHCEPKDGNLGVFSALNFKLHPKGHVESLTIEEKSGDSIQITFDKPQVQFVP